MLIMLPIIVEMEEFAVGREDGNMDISRQIN